jgi:hypothetical protein
MQAHAHRKACQIWNRLKEGWSENLLEGWAVLGCLGGGPRVVGRCWEKRKIDSKKPKKENILNDNWFTV